MSKSIEQVAFERWYINAAPATPTLADAFIAGQELGIAIGKRMAAMEDEMTRYTLTEAGRKLLDGGK